MQSCTALRNASLTFSNRRARAVLCTERAGWSAVHWIARVRSLNLQNCLVNGGRLSSLLFCSNSDAVNGPWTISSAFFDGSSSALEK